MSWHSTNLRREDLLFWADGALFVAVAGGWLDCERCSELAGCGAESRQWSAPGLEVHRHAKQQALGFDVGASAGVKQIRGIFDDVAQDAVAKF